jgi:hypothetical protein
MGRQVRSTGTSGQQRRRGTKRRAGVAKRPAASPTRATDDSKGRVALRLTRWAIVATGLLAAYAMFRGDRELLDRIMHLIEYVVMFLCGWAGGRSKGP